MALNVLEEKIYTKKKKINYLLRVGTDFLGYLGFLGNLKVFGRRKCTEVRILRVRVPLTPLITYKKKEKNLINFFCSKKIFSISLIIKGSEVVIFVFSLIQRDSHKVNIIIVKINLKKKKIYQKSILTLTWARLALITATDFALAVPFWSLPATVGFFNAVFGLTADLPTAFAIFLTIGFLTRTFALPSFLTTLAFGFVTPAGFLAGAAFFSVFLTAGFFSGALAAGLAAAGLAAAGFAAAGFFSAVLAAVAAAAGFFSVFFSAGLPAKNKKKQN